MNDPIPLSDDSTEATDFERSLLQCAQEQRLPSEARREIWAGIALQCLPAAVVVPPAATAAAHAGLKLGTWLKGLVFLASLGGLGAAAHFLLHSPAVEPPQVGASVVSKTPVTEAMTRDEAPAAAAVIAEPERPVVAPPPSAHEVVNRETTLRDESLAVLEARRALRSGSAGHAVRLLEQARLRFPKGALGQEREALTIEALAKTGDSANAQRRARAFLRSYPKSPYAADVQSLAKP